MPSFLPQTTLGIIAAVLVFAALFLAIGAAITYAWKSRSQFDAGSVEGNMNRLMLFFCIFFWPIALFVFGILWARRAMRKISSV
jgi:hypothetical protein